MEESKIMKITVIRQIFDDACTMGTMSVDDIFQCYTLEPPNKPGIDPIAPKGCVPLGIYGVSITFSPHFNRDMPLINDIPNFEDVRIHMGNFPSNTEGCCLVGETQGKDAILQSVAAFDPLFTKIQDAINSGDTVTIEYTKEQL